MKPSRLLSTLGVSLALAACGPASIGVDAPLGTHALPLEGPRNDALRRASARHGVPVELLMVLAQHQSRFELPTTDGALDEAALEPMTAEPADAADPTQEVEAPMPLDADLEADLDTPLEPEAPLVLAPDPSDDGLVTQLEDGAEVTDPEAVADPEADAEALAAGEPHVADTVYGIMHLTPAQAERAAVLTGLTAADIREDLAANVDAAAALLADDARAAGLAPDGLDLAAWAPVLTRFVGADDAAEVATLTMTELGALYAEGFDVTTEDGERLALVGPAETFGARAAALVNGAYPDIDFVPAASTNYASSRRGGRLRFVVIHDMEGTVPGAIATFRNPGRQASAHYLVRSRDGQVFQMVRETATAWHSGHGYINANSIGIEHEGFADRPRGGGYYTARMYEASAHLTCAIAKRYGVPIDRRHIFGHGNVPSNQSSRTLCSDAQSVRGACGGRSHHHDPGRHWDWATYMRLVARCVSNRATTPAPQPTPPPSAARTTVKGIIYRGRDEGARLAGVTVQLGSSSTRTNAEGVYVLRGVPRGNHTITASKDGFVRRSITRAVSGSETWGSMGLSPRAPTGNATLVGIIYRGAPSRRVAGATVSLSNGRTARTNAEGVYAIGGLAPGTYAITARKSGVGSARTSRTVGSGQKTWGSVGL